MTAELTEQNRGLIRPSISPAIQEEPVLPVPPVTFGTPRIEREDTVDGRVLLRSRDELAPHSVSMVLLQTQDKRGAPVPRCWSVRALHEPSAVQM